MTLTASVNVSLQTYAIISFDQLLDLVDSLFKALWSHLGSFLLFCVAIVKINLFMYQFQTEI